MLQLPDSVIVVAGITSLILVPILYVVTWLITWRLVRDAYRQFGQRLQSADPHTWEMLRAHDQLDLLVRYRWYQRLRRYVRGGPSGPAQSDDLNSSIKRLKRALEVFELQVLLLLVAIVAITVQNI